MRGIANNGSRQDQAIGGDHRHLRVERCERRLLAPASRSRSGDAHRDPQRLRPLLGRATGINEPPSAAHPDAAAGYRRPHHVVPRRDHRIQYRHGEGRECP